MFAYILIYNVCKCIVWLKQYICTLLIICYIPSALNHSFAAIFCCAYHIANDKNWLLFIFVARFQDICVCVCIDYMAWLYGSICVYNVYMYDGRITRARAFHSNGMFGYKDAIDLPFMLLHILHLRRFSLSLALGFLFRIPSFSIFFFRS